MANIPRPEYPNPIFQREDWINLNGAWAFEIDNGNSGAARGLWKRDAVLSGSITVPFCPESALSGVGHKDFMAAVWYQRTVTVTAEQAKKRAFLRFGAVDFHAVVYVGGEEAGEHFGGYSSFSTEVTGKLRAGDNIITVYAQDDVRSPMQARGKQSEEFYSHACDYTRTTGIWQTVYLEFVPKNFIKGVKYFPNIETASLQIEAELEGEGVFTVEALWDGQPVGKASSALSGNAVSLTLTLSEKHSWEIGKGGLYTLKLTFGEDAVDSYFGLREVGMQNGKFLLNGKSVFQRLVLDQGFYPDGVYTAPSEDALIGDIEMSMAVGFNGARLHQKIFEPRFLYHCDRLGYMVWGEHGNWGMDISDYQTVKYFLPEWLETLERDFNHPAIVGWCPFNETWDYKNKRQDDDILRTVYKVTKAYDKTRPCIDSSGGYHVITDIFDVHDYDQNPDSFKAHYDELVTDGELYDQLSIHHPGRQEYRGEPVFMSEYGGIRWSVDSADKKAWGYGNAPKTQEEFMARYKGLSDALLGNERIFGFCYTQLTDVEQEQNGIYTFDRKEKFDAAALRAINSRKAKIED